MPSDVDYVNLALNQLGARPIVALTPSDSQAAAIALPIYEFTVDNLLSKTSWRGATTRVTLSRLTTSPANTNFKYEYALPNGTLRIVRTDKRDDHWMLYRDMESGYKRLYSNREAVKADIVLRPDAALFPQHFQALLVAELAAALALPITRRADVKQAAEQAAVLARAEAVTTDWNEQPWPELDDGDTLTQAKYGGVAGTVWPEGWD